LDEIGAMSVAAQAKLLGVLEDRIFYKVGGDKPIKVTARVTAATNMDLERAVSEEQFRRDLFFRINVVNVHLPSLRERTGDIVLLANHFMNLHTRKFRKHFTSISSDAVRLLETYSWPGNVRELNNTIERIILLEDNDILLPEHLYFIQSDDMPDRTPDVDSKENDLDFHQTVKTLIKEALKKTQGNISEAARILKIPLHKLRYQIKKYEIRED